MSWALIRNRAPYEGSQIPPSWFFAPQLGPKLLTSDHIEETDRVTATDATFRCYPAPDGTIYLMTPSAESVTRDLTPEMRADLLSILGPLTDEEKNLHG